MSSKQIIHIRSKDVNQLSAGLNTHFNVNLKQPIAVGLHNNALISVIAAEIPYSFYCISHSIGNNKFYYDDSHFVFPNQNYDVDSILSQINLNTPFTASFNEYTCKILFTNNDVVSHTIKISLSNSAQLLGLTFDGDSYTIPSGASFSGKGILDLASVHSLLVRCDLASANIQSSKNGNSTILQSIPVNVNPYEVIYLNNSNSITVSEISTHKIDMISFRITDQNSNLINMNHVNYEFTLQVEILKNDNFIELKEDKVVKNTIVKNEVLEDKKDEKTNIDLSYDNEESLLDLLLED
tara:strand:- start:144 stop:1031 length:888 start_codon:yes stop_codon:yes gene_type:complete